MALDIKQATTVTEPLQEALLRLLPQLSSYVRIPTPEELQAVVANPMTALFAAWAEDRIVGVLTLTWYDTPTGRKAWIEDVVVDTAVRGSGAGEALVRTALNHAEHIGAEKVMLTSSPRRKAAHALYRKTGFEAVETTVFARKTDTK